MKVLYDTVVFNFPSFLNVRYLKVHMEQIMKEKKVVHDTFVFNYAVRYKIELHVSDMKNENKKCPTTLPFSVSLYFVTWHSPAVKIFVDLPRNALRSDKISLLDTRVVADVTMHELN